MRGLLERLCVGWREPSDDTGRSGRVSLALFVWVPFALSIGVGVYLLRHDQFAFDFRRGVAAPQWRSTSSPGAWSDSHAWAAT